LAKLEQKRSGKRVADITIDTQTADIDRIGLDRNKLAKRLGVSGPTITKYQQQDRMEELSLKYDPDGTVWHYNPDSELFIPQRPLRTVVLTTLKSALGNIFYLGRQGLYPNHTQKSPIPPRVGG